MDKKKRWKVVFQSNERKELLLVARRFVMEANLRIERPEHFQKPDELYVLVVCSEESLKGALKQLKKKKVHVTHESAAGSLGMEECLNCGNVPGVAWAICPCCGFNEISACPHCNVENPRSTYRGEGPVYSCPKCSGKVRLRFADPMWTESGHYVQPLIEVTEP